jgi:hypothetical protein
MTWTLLASEFRLKRFKTFSFLRIAAANFGLVAQHLNIDETIIRNWPDNAPGVMPKGE